MQIKGLTADVSYPHFQGLRWRVDVIISNSNVKRALKPSLVLQFTLDDGRIKHMECSVEKFSELRFNVSRVLREMQVLQQRMNKHVGNYEQNVNTNAMFSDYCQNFRKKYEKQSEIAGLNNLTSLLNAKQSNAIEK